MMKWRNTWLLLGMAGALFAFIVVYERHADTTLPSVPSPLRLFPRLKTSQVSALHVRLTNQFALKVERNGERWRLTAPLNYSATPVAVEGFLTALENAVAPIKLSPREMNSRGQKLADFGLAAPQAEIVVEQGRERLQLQIGGHLASGGQVYAQVVGTPGVYLLDAALLSLLPRSVNDWRNLALLDLADTDIDRVEVIKATGGLFLQRDATNLTWQLNRPRQRADQLKVDGLLEKIRQARVAQFVSDDPKADGETFGLQPPQLELVLGRGTSQVQCVQFGKAPPQDLANVYVRRLDQTNIVLVSKSVLDLLQTPVTEFRDRRLLAVAPANLTLLEVRSDEPFAVRRQTNDIWLAGENTPADPLFMRDWLQRLGRLQIDEFVKDVVTDFSAYGLAQPCRAYVLRTSTTNAAGATNITVGELHFGTNTQQRIFVRRADEDSVYAVSYLDFCHMPSAAWQLRDHRVWTFTTNQVARVTLQQAGRNRTLLRGPNAEWTLAPGSQGIINPLAVEEMLFRLGELRATAWTARGAENLPRYGFAATNLHVTVDLKAGDSPRTLSLDFGGPAPNRFPYAAVALEGQVWIFEFPWTLFQDFDRAFGLPLTF